MTIKCHLCETPLIKEFGSYRYKESGLDNIFIENATFYKCNSCGTLIPSIFRLPRLNELIAEALLKKPALLNGKEIRFLRKNLFLSSQVFSNLLGIGKTTLSKWENNRQLQSEGNDRHIRSFYMIKKNFTYYNSMKIIKYLEKIRLKKPIVDYIITAEQIKNDYRVILKTIGGTIALQHLNIIGYFWNRLQTSTAPQWRITNKGDIVDNTIIVCSRECTPQTISFAYGM